MWEQTDEERKKCDYISYARSLWTIFKFSRAPKYPVYLQIILITGEF